MSTDKRGLFSHKQRVIEIDRQKSGREGNVADECPAEAEKTLRD